MDIAQPKCWAFLFPGQPMITLADYFGKWLDHPDATGTRQDNARRLLAACAALEAEMIAAGVVFPINPKTGSGVSGTEYGGFRPQCCEIGAEHSSHKEGRAVDRYDPYGDIDDWLICHKDSLENHGLHIEHPLATLGWSHWTDRAPLSGRVIFFP